MLSIYAEIVPGYARAAGSLGRRNAIGETSPGLVTSISRLECHQAEDPSRSMALTLDLLFRVLFHPVYYHFLK